MRILIVDDNPAIHEDFRKILISRPREQPLAELERELFGEREPVEPPPSARGFEFSLESVYQGERAIVLAREALAQGRPFQLAFVDGRMPPGMSGIDTIAGLWEVDPRLQVVVCTAFSDHSWTEIVRKLGHSDGLLVLRKPFDSIEVLQLAHALTRKWILGHALRQRLDDLEVAVSARTQALEAANQELRVQIDQRTRAENDFRHLATHDPVTGIPNRVLLRERMMASLARAERNGTSVALILVDLDHFKEVNDSYGHPAGDELLRVMAERLRSCVRASDVVARIGGDEFVLLLEDIQRPEEAAAVA
jgi:GGDEF domain-containing protein